VGLVFLDHAQLKMAERGTSEAEVIETLERGQQEPAREGRLSKAWVFEYDAEWNGKHYRQKRVEAIYKLEGEDTVVLTVYTFYGQWEVNA
jgi:hypothetical protein